MSEPTIICPKCKTEIKLTESLAAPLVESIRRDYEDRLTKKDTDIAKRETSLREQETALSKAKEAIEDQVAEKLRQERSNIAAEETRKAKLAYGNDLDQKTKELTDLQDLIKQRDAKPAEAQKAQVELLKKQRELDDAKREIDLTVEKRVPSKPVGHTRSGPQGTVGMYGDLQGIAGKTLREIEGLEMKALETPSGILPSNE